MQWGAKSLSARGSASSLAAESFGFSSVLFQGGFSHSENWKAARKPERKNCNRGVWRRGDMDGNPPSSLTGRQLGESAAWK